MRRSLEAPLSSSEALVDRAQFIQLAEGGSHEFVFRIDPGVRHTAYGACDDNCSDINLEARNASGSLVDKDVEDDEEPLVRILPGATDEQLRVRISLERCDAAACLVGVALFRSN